jgi:hypothetical protein
MSMSMWIALENGQDTSHLFEGREEQFGNGQSIPRHVVQLDETSHALGLPALLDFVLDLNVIDDTLPPPWFDPATALTTIRGLLNSIATINSHDQQRMADDSLHSRILGSDATPEIQAALRTFAVAAVTADLRTFEAELEFAVEQRTRFHFLLSY